MVQKIVVIKLLKKLLEKNLKKYWNFFWKKMFEHNVQIYIIVHFCF
jgi:hypothetical protein